MVKRFITLDPGGLLKLESVSDKFISILVTIVHKPILIKSIKDC
jgi:hypothetical protein